MLVGLTSEGKIIEEYEMILRCLQQLLNFFFLSVFITIINF